MPINEEIAATLLKILEDVYPESMHVSDMKKQIEGFDREHSNELMVLHDEELIKAIVAEDLLTPPHVINASITTKGRKFLAGRQNYLTVKLHPDTINDLRQILLTSVEESALPDTQKAEWKKAIKSYPTAIVSALVRSLISKGMDSVQDITSWLGTLGK